VYLCVKAHRRANPGKDGAPGAVDLVIMWENKLVIMWENKMIRTEKFLSPSIALLTAQLVDFKLPTSHVEWLNKLATTVIR
jgi:hypothetical protein